MKNEPKPVTQAELAKALETTPRCDRCACWLRFHGEVNGRCQALPPTAAANGNMVPQPITRENMCCVTYFRPLPIGIDPKVKEKNQPASPAQALRDRRKGI